MKDIVSQFKNAILKQRLSHLYLLAGSKGIHKKRIARELAYEIFKHESDSPALKHQLETDNYPNLIYVPLEGLSIKKEQILSLQKEFSKTSLVEGSRVYIIENVESMSLPAANSLLKFLEEPKDNQTIGFLLTDDVNQVISTILSRSQIILVEDDEKLFQEELEKHDVDDKHATLIYFLTSDIEEAFNYYEDEMYHLSVNYIERWIEWFIKPDQPLSFLVMEMISALGQDKKWIEFILQVLSTMFLDVIHQHMNQKTKLLYLKETIIELVRGYDVTQCERVINAIHETLKQMSVPVVIPLVLQALAIKIEQSRG